MKPDNVFDQNSTRTEVAPAQPGREDLAPSPEIKLPPPIAPDGSARTEPGSQVLTQPASGLGETTSGKPTETTTTPATAGQPELIGKALVKKVEGLIETQAADPGALSADRARLAAEYQTNGFGLAIED